MDNAINIQISLPINEGQGVKLWPTFERENTAFRETSVFFFLILCFKLILPLILQYRLRKLSLSSVFPLNPQKIVVVAFF